MTRLLPLLATLLWFLSQASVAESKLVHYIFVIEYFSGAPDGVYKEKILGINGQFPGPTIEASVGDTLQVDVINRIQDGQNTSLHWHGVHQKKSHFEDGTSLISQCPLANLQTQRYSFILEQAGTFWYHSHVNSQYTEGLWGALIVNNQPEVYAYDGEILIALSDWYHRTAIENEHWHISAPSRGVPPYPDSGLINGLGRYHCGYASIQDRSCNMSQQLRPVFRVQPQKTYRVRVINTSAVAAFNFSIDGHSLETIEVDGVDVARTGKSCDVASVAAAQRYSFLIRTSAMEDENSSNRFIIHSDMRKESLMLIEGVNINKFPEAVQGDVTAVLEYSDDASEDFENVKGRCKLGTEPHSYLEEVYSVSPVRSEAEITYLDEMDLSPYDGVPAPSKYDLEVVLDAGFFEDHEDIRRGSFNETPFKFPPSGKPLLMSLVDGEEIPTEVFPVEVEYMQVVQIVLNNPFFGPHPFHMHGHHFWVLGTGGWNDGNFDPNRHNVSLKLTGPRRDTVLVQEQSWAVIRYIADNPGIWSFHCHIDWHNLSGMSMTFVEAKELARERIKVTEEARRICAQHGNGEGFPAPEPTPETSPTQRYTSTSNASCQNYTHMQIPFLLGIISLLVSLS